MKKTTFLLTLLFTSLCGFAQNTYYSQDFESGDLSGWTVTDSDGDGYDWNVLNASSVNTNIGTGSLMSFSWTSTTGPLDPDNLVTSPAIDLTGATAESNMYLFFNHLLGDATYPDKYSVYVTTSNDPAVIAAATPVLTVTPTNVNLTNKSVDITSFIGQTIYVSFRHYESLNQYYILIDDVAVRSVGNNDAALLSAKLNRYSLLSTDNMLTLTVKNVGLNAITALTLNWNDGTTDHISTIAKSIPVGATSTTVTHPIKINYASVVEKGLNITVTAVNGNTDPVMANNMVTKKFNTVSQASTKRVLFEEGTGTWCGWCPRGAVAMAYMDTTYPNEFIGVAVHNQDPMMIDEYDAGAGFSSFPGMNVDRVVKGADVSQTAMTSNLNTRKVLTTPVSLETNGAVNGSEVTINAFATFRTVFTNANYRLGVIITEDNVSDAADTGYNQTNYYAANANGIMGGYEALANPVPAADMVYNHVGRDLVGGYDGQADSVPSSITDGQVVNYTFNYSVPSTSNIDNMHGVLVLIDQQTGEVVNSKSFELATLAVNSNQVNPTVSLYPNPSTDYFTINNLKSGIYTVTIYDMSGKAVQTVKQKEVIENQSLTISTKGMAAGAYVVNIATGNTSYSKQLMVK
ncbi:MAG: hypothetical protein RL427_631 [Bacteroidota bacterium]|jgi:hypothetical protein